MIKKDIFKKDVREQFRASAKDRLYRFMLADRTIKGAIVLFFFKQKTAYEITV